MFLTPLFGAPSHVHRTLTSREITCVRNLSPRRREVQAEWRPAQAIVREERQRRANLMAVPAYNAVTSPSYAVAQDRARASPPPLRSLAALPLPNPALSLHSTDARRAARRTTGYSQGTSSKGSAPTELTPPGALALPERRTSGSTRESSGVGGTSCYPAAQGAPCTRRSRHSAPPSTGGRDERNRVSSRRTSSKGVAE